MKIRGKHTYPKTHIGLKPSMESNQQKETNEEIMQSAECENLRKKNDNQGKTHISQNTHWSETINGIQPTKGNKCISKGRKNTQFKNTQRKDLPRMDEEPPAD